MDDILEDKIKQLADQCYKDQDFLSSDLVKAVHDMNILDRKFDFILVGYSQSLNEGKIYPIDFISKINFCLKMQDETQPIMNPTHNEDSGRGSQLSMTFTDQELFIADKKKPWGENETQAKHYIEASNNLLDLPSSARPINVLAVEEMGKIEGQCTLLGYAAFAGNKELIDLLLDNGADPTFRGNYYKKTILIGLAQVGGDPEIGRKLIEHQARYDGEKDFLINAADYNGWSAFLYACHLGHMKMVEMLLDYPMLDINHSATGRRQGLTALHVAALKNNTNLCHILLDKGADAGRKADVGIGIDETPLEIARREKFLETISVLKNWH